MFEIRNDQLVPLAKQGASRQIASALSEHGLEVALDDSTFVLAITDKRKNTWKLELDQHGNPESLTTPLQRRFDLGFDLDKRLTRFVDPSGIQAEIAYDGDGRPTSVGRGKTPPLKLEYDERGNFSRVLHPDTTQSRLSYDHQDMLEIATDRLGRTERYEHDSLGRLVTIVDANGNQTSFAYRESIRPDRMTYANGAFEGYAYDSAGLVQKGTASGSPWFECKRDGGGRIRQLRFSDGLTVTLEYDDAGRLKKASNGEHEVEYVHDSKGRLSKDIQDGRSIGYEYDDASLLTAITLPTGEKISYRYDADGRLAEIEDWDGRKHVFRYLDGERVVEHLYPNGVVTQTTRSDGSLSQITASHPDAGVCFSQTYRYNDEGLVAECHDLHEGTSRYEYDAEGQLQRAIRDKGRQQESFRYDKAGNSTQALGAGAQFNSLNQLVRLQDATYSYDELGNLAVESSSHGETRYIFNRRNHLVAVIKPDGSEIKFSYDPFGRRITKTVGGVTTRFLWAGNQLLSEQLEGRPDGALRRDYLFMPNAFTPVSLRAGKVCYQFHCDRLGVPCRLTDQFGKVAWSATYSAFGKANVARSQIDNPLRFPGQYHDVETGLHYNIARYYAPNLGRYLSRDPLSFLTGLNLYLYAGNNFLNDIDPLGLASLTPGWLKATVAGITAAAVGGLVLAALGPGGIILAGAVAGAVYAALDSYMTDAKIPCPTTVLKGAAIGALAAIPFALLPTGAGVIMFAGAGLASGEIGYIANWAFTPGVAWDNDAFLESALFAGLTAGAARYLAGRVGQTTLEKNVEAGRAFEQRGLDHLETVQSNVEDQVSIRPYTETGELADYRVRLDAVGTDESGSIRLTDFKSSETAGFTPNQEAGYPLLKEHGGQVVGNNGGAAYPAGTQIPPTEVDILRPGDF